MLFLNLLGSDLCHRESVVLRPGPALFCDVCQKNVIPNLYEYINRPHEDYFRSSDLAQAYGAWTGDENVPLSFPLSHIEGIYDTIVVGQPLHRVRKSIRLLRALNSPFTGERATLPLDDMKSFLADFLNIIYEHPDAESSDERKALDALMKSMHSIASVPNAIDPFEMYFSVLVPYVQTCMRDWQPFAAEPEHPNLARELHLQLVRSHCIRKVFSRYAIPFDVIHVMVGCFTCSCNMTVVGNWAIDFLMRICKGDFYWKNYPDCIFVKTMQRLVQHLINRNNHSDYYKFVIRPIRIGESVLQYSQLWYPLHEAQALLKKKYTLPHVPADVMDMAFVQMFPATLFTDHADQLGFTMGYNHLIMTVNRRNGHLPKGAFKKARLIHDVVRRVVQRVQEFDAGHQKPIWNLDMLKLFFASDPHFHDEIMKVVHWLVMDEDEEE